MTVLNRYIVLLVASLALPGAAPRVRAEGLGSSVGDSGSITFRVYSARATQIQVWLYDQPAGQPEKLSVSLNEDTTTHVWSQSVSAEQLSQAGLTGTVFYGYRAWGPNWPFVSNWQKGSAEGFVSDVDDDGNRFNPNKLLLDPYAREVSHDYRTPSQPDATVYLSGSANRTTDTGARAPKGIVLPPDGTDIGVKPARTLKDEVIYEVHLRGLTKNDPSVPAALQGTYAGAARKADDLKALGITTIEFLPVFEFQNDTNGVIPNSAAGDNYWGYDPDSYFAPDRRYANDKSWGGPTREFKAMVRAFHNVGVKVILDVVYNHTGEADVDKDTGTIGAIHSWRGLDNATYYELRDDNAHYLQSRRPTQWRRGGFYANHNGVGPDYNAATSVGCDLALDSLRYWSDVMGVDGFRFDLAAILGNSQTRDDFTFDQTAPNNFLNRAVRELPARGPDGSGVDLIAEPYGATDGTFQLGKFPAGWAEWDDRFRYPIRKAQNKLGISGNEVAPAALITLFAGSSDLFKSSDRRPYHGINYVVAHDGFTLRDLYSFLDKQNQQPFPFGPSAGGSDNNYSWDQGGDPARQRQAARTGLALLLVSAGVPMIGGGDEMYRTQFGNNNPFNLDNEKFYLDYSLQGQFPHFFVYAKRMIAFRRAHAALRRSEFLDGKDHNGNELKDVTWLRDDGQEADGGYLDNPDNHFIAFRLDGTEVGDSSASIYVAYNGWKDDITATIPATAPGNHWCLAVDTSAALEDQDNSFEPPRRRNESRYNVAARSVIVLVEQP